MVVRWPTNFYMREVKYHGSKKANLGPPLKKYETLFDGTLGDWKVSLISLDLKEGTTPYHGRAYPIPQIHKRSMRIKVDRLIYLGVLKECNDSEWGAPNFIIPKKRRNNSFN